MIKVSIIVPVHNAGKYLIQCLDSLIKQTLKDIEIILVLDLPTDGSDEVCEEYAKRDKRIKLIRNKENLHIGFSRNEGIKIAKGKYIGFADHDDYCELNMFEHLYNVAELNNAEVVISNIYSETDNQQDHYSFPTGYSNIEFNDKLFISLLSGNPSKKNTYSFDNANTIWNQLYKNTFLKNNNIRFCDNRKVTIEDVIFNIKVHFFATHTYFLSERLYHHVNHDKNTFGSYDYLSISKVIPHLKEIHSFLKENNAWQHYKELFVIYTIKRLYTSFRNEIKFKGLFHSFDAIEQIRKSQEIQSILEEQYTYNQTVVKLKVTKKIFRLIIKKRLF